MSLTVKWRLQNTRIVSFKREQKNCPIQGRKIKKMETRNRRLSGLWEIVRLSMKSPRKRRNKVEKYLRK